MNHSSAEFLGRCGGENNLSKELVGDLAYSVDILIRQCAAFARQDAGELAARDHATGGGEARAWRLLREANEELELLQAAIDGRTEAASNVEAYVVGRIMHYYAGGQRNVGVIAPSVEDWNAEQTEKDLRNTYLNLMNVAGEAQAARHLLAEYPWRGGTCEVPEHATDPTLLEAWYEEINTTATSIATPRESQTLNWHGRLIFRLQPAMEIYGTHGWWEGLLDVHGRLEIQEAYWTARGQSIEWPSLEPVAELVGNYSTDPNLWMDYRMRWYQDYLTDLTLQTAQPWGESPQMGGPSFLAVISTAPPYRFMDCAE